MKPIFSFENARRKAHKMNTKFEIVGGWEGGGGWIKKQAYKTTRTLEDYRTGLLSSGRKRSVLASKPWIKIPYQIQ